MNNTSNLQKSSSQNKFVDSNIIFSLDRKDYTIRELLTIFSGDFLKSHLSTQCHPSRITLRSNPS